MFESIIILVVAILYAPLCNLIGLALRPDIVLVLVFVFSLNRAINIPILIITGVVIDALNFNVLGITAIMLALFSVLIRTNISALAKQKFNIIWLLFIILVAIYILLIGLADWYFKDYVLNPKHLIFEFIATSLIFPASYRFINKNITK